MLGSNRENTITSFYSKKKSLMGRPQGPVPASGVAHERAFQAPMQTPQGPSEKSKEKAAGRPLALGKRLLFLRSLVDVQQLLFRWSILQGSPSKKQAGTIWGKVQPFCGFNSEKQFVSKKCAAMPLSVPPAPNGNAVFRRRIYHGKRVFFLRKLATRTTSEPHPENYGW